jgi:hypothetical protein
MYHGSRLSLRSNEPFLFCCPMRSEFYTQRTRVFVLGLLIGGLSGAVLTE